MNEFKYVIVGGGLAGQRACAAIRGLDAEGPMALICAEAHLPYERPALSKGYLTGKEGLEHVVIKDEDYYTQGGIALLRGVRATRLTPGDHTLHLEDGRQLGYAKLLLATGGTAVRLPLPGADLNGVFVLRTIEDADGIRSLASTGRRAVVLGGSFIGCEVTASLITLGLDVTMVFPEERLLQRVLPVQASDHLRAMYEAKGARILSGAKPVRFDGRGSVESVLLDNGASLPADLVVMGVGIRLNTELARDAGLALTERGAVVVDRILRTSDPDIYAVGDITAWPSRRFGKSLRLEHWDVARRQGTHAGRNMAGEDKPYVALPYFYSDLFHLNLEAWGDLSAWERTVLRGDLAADHFAFYYFSSDRLSGVLTVGRPEAERDPMQALVRAGPTYEEVAAKLADEKVDLASLAG